MQSWNEYGGKFDKLCSSLRERDKACIEEQLTSARSQVNGMTDGWYEFVELFEKAIRVNRRLMVNDELDIANELITHIHKMLKR